MALTIKLRDGIYTATDIADMDLIMVSSILGDEIAPEEGTPLYEAWQDRLMYRMRDPILQASAAFAMVSMFDDLPDEVIRYNLFRQTDGEYRVEHRFKLNTQEYVDLCTQLSELMTQRAKGMPSDLKTSRTTKKSNKKAISA